MYDDTMFEAPIPQLLLLTTQTGDAILSYYGIHTAVEMKSNNTPITQADKIAHNLLEIGLKKIMPNTPILSEESKHIVFEACQNWQEYWLIDPLDGTREFVNQTDEFCICIAYIKNNQAIFGLIYDPVNRVHYYTHHHQTFRLKAGKTTQLFTKKTHQPLRVVTGRHSHHNPKLQAHLRTLGNIQTFELGSALKFCKIAEGHYDYYPRFGACSEWDSAAGACILRMAGGSVVNALGEELRYNQNKDFLSPDFFASNKTQ
jgi:3'(2'), 5'-bisphosphate nucleotidase